MVIGLGLLDRLNTELGKTIVMVTHDPRAADEWLRGLDHFERIGRCHQDLREQRVGIESDRRYELVELRCTEERLLLLVLSQRRAERNRQDVGAKQSALQPRQRDGAEPCTFATPSSRRRWRC